MKNEDFKSAERIHESLLSQPEKRILNWLAARLPPWIHPDHLTALGFAAMTGAGFFYYLSSFDPKMLHLVNFCLAANWFGDSLDGTVARYRNRQRPRYGFYVDHITDAVGTMFLLTGLAFSGFMSERVAFALLTAYLLLSINSYLWAHTMSRFHLSCWRFSPTELRVLLIVGNLYLLGKPEVSLFGSTMKLFDIGGVAGASLMAVVLLSSAIKNTKQLYCLERL
jgi:archaetidylinositol phosphate synthase